MRILALALCVFMAGCDDPGVPIDKDAKLAVEPTGDLLTDGVGARLTIKIDPSAGN